MVLIRTIRARLWLFAPVFLPLALWFSLWFSLQAGDIEKIGSGKTIWLEAQNLRAILPLLSGMAGISVIGYYLLVRRVQKSIFYGPLGLTVVYGIIGIASVLLSPDSSVALYWVAIYLSAPLVLLAIASNGNPLTRVSQLLMFNWVVVLVAVIALVVVAFAFLNLHKVILDPSNLLECKLRTPFLGESWHELTSGKLRSTGVGRYSAIAALIALGGLWHGRARPVSALILVGALLLLFTSGARTSFVGFGFATALVIFLHGGWKAALASVGGLAIVISILWGTGLSQPILEHCFLSGYQTGTSLLRIQPIVPTEQTVQTSGTSVPTPIVSIPQVEPLQPEGQVEPVEQAEQRTEIFGVLIPSGFGTYSGRTIVWQAGWDRLKESPLLGYGFQGDRLVLGTHMHNAMLHALFQTGWIGFIFFAGAFIWAWIYLGMALTRLARLPVLHKHLLIQSAGILAFLTLRGIWESTGAFFGVDWLILCVIFFYIQLVNTELNNGYETSSILETDQEPRVFSRFRFLITSRFRKRSKHGSSGQHFQER